jgi:hypothetical protein
VVSVIAGGLIAIGVVVIPVSLAIVPLVILENGEPGLPRLLFGVSTAVVLGSSTIRLAAPKRPWADPIRWRLLARLEGRTDLSEQEEEEQEDILEPVLRPRLPLPSLGGPTSRELRASTWPMLALMLSATVALWTPGVEPETDYFTALAQVLPVLLVAAFVEGARCTEFSCQSFHRSSPTTQAHPLIRFSFHS